MTDLSCEDYSDKAIVVRGDTKDHKEDLKKLGGKFNANLRDGPGWIFSKKNEDIVLGYIVSGRVVGGEEKKQQKIVPKTTSQNLRGSTEILLAIESCVKTMNPQERLTFLTSVIGRISSCPYVTTKDNDTDVSRVQVTVVKKSSSSDEDTPKTKPKPLVTTTISRQAPKINSTHSDIEESDDDVPPPKRLLR